MSIWLTIRMTEWVNNRISKWVCTESIKNKLLKINDYTDRCVIFFTQRCNGTSYHYDSLLRTSIALCYLKQAGREFVMFAPAKGSQTMFYLGKNVVY